MRKNNFFKQIKKDLNNKKKVKSSFYFLLFFLVSFIVIYLVLSKTILYVYINYFYGLVSTFLLNVIYSVDASFVFDNILNASIINISSLGYPVIINSLCTGILEFTLLVSAIISSIGVSWRNRLYGVLTAIGVVIIFNSLRITFTTFIITRFNLSIANFLHGFLFRLFLIIIVIGTYWLWLRYVYKQ